MGGTKRTIVKRVRCGDCRGTGSVSRSTWWTTNYMQTCPTCGGARTVVIKYTTY